MRGEQLKLFTPDDDSSIKNRRRLVVIPLDTFILSSVVITLLFVLAFSLGIERGRKSYYATLENKEDLVKDIIIDDEQPNKIQAKTETINVKKEPIKTVNTVNIPRAVVPAVKKEVVPQVENVKAEVNVSYNIQIASYNKESFAQEEGKVLQGKGFPVRILKKTDYVVLYVGPFKTKPEADKSMRLLKKTYKDCILRRF
ncbi:MAG: SPOR domain-containing protein [Candidatus Omnitrophota bacterium]|jgi:hypothetical protein